MTESAQPGDAASPIPDEIAQRVIAVVAAARDLSPDQVSLDDKLQDLGLDSLDGLNLFFDIEEAFDVKIPDDVARKISTVRDIAQQLSLHAAAAPEGEV